MSKTKGTHARGGKDTPSNTPAYNRQNINENTIIDRMYWSIDLIWKSVKVCACTRSLSYKNHGVEFIIIKYNYTIIGISIIILITIPRE